MFQYPNMQNSHQPNSFISSAILFNQLTDCAGGFSVPFPSDKKILLETIVKDDGIGDLIHQIRVYQCLNQLYPGQIICRTKAVERHSNFVAKTASEYNFPYSEYFSETAIQSIILRLLVSYEEDSMTLNLPDVRTYDLTEIANVAEIYTNIEICLYNGYFGLLPHSQGIWYDDVPRNIDKSQLFDSVSDDFKKAFWFLPEVDIEQWMNQTWICESHFYGMNKSLISLLAQLIYLKNNPGMKRCVVKLHGKNRYSLSWFDRLISTLQSAHYKDFLKEIGLGKVYYQDLDGNTQTVVIDGEGGINLYLVRARLNLKDYSVFKQLINGMICPAGDNSYCEALSNGNTHFPPLMELRDYKLHLAADLSEISSPCLKEFFKLSVDLSTNFTDGNKVRYEKDLAPKAIQDKSHHIADFLLQQDKDIQSGWKVLHKQLAHHDISKRLPAIVKEQLLFQKFPDLIQAKLDLMNDKTMRVETKILEYTREIQATLERCKPVYRQ